MTALVINELNQVTDRFLNVVKTINNPEVELAEICKFLHIINNKDAELIGLKWKNLSLEKKQETLDEIYETGIVFDQVENYGAIEEIERRNVISDIYSTFSYMDQRPNTVDQYVANENLRASSLASIKSDIFGTRNRALMTYEESLRHNTASMIGVTDFSVNLENLSRKEISKKVVVPFFKMKIKYRKSKKFVGGMECIAKITYYIPNHGSLSKAFAYSATIRVDLAENNSMYKSYAMKLAFQEFQTSMYDVILKDDDMDDSVGIEYLCREFADVIREDNKYIKGYLN